MKPFPPKRRHCAYSLLELIIAIALLLVLALLSMSVVRGLNERSKNVRCLQNLKQVGVALFAYAADHQQMIPPRNLGLYRDAEARPPVRERAWVNRLVLRGYADNPDIFYCPSLTPTRNQLSDDPLPSSETGPIRTYGIRTWVPPGSSGFGKKPIQEEHKPLSLISDPADFFLVVDTVWVHPSYESQGYGINPGMGLEQLVHVRHHGKANALFADGHVEGKPARYFEELHLPNRQRAYSGGKDLPFGVTTEVPF